MRSAGTASWRLDVKDGSGCELGLFVRDAAGLEIVGPGGDVPPLTGSVPDLARVLEPPARVAAGTQWPRWWEQLLGLELPDRAGREEEAAVHAQRLAADHDAVCDPPTFAALADRPELRAAARSAFPAYLEWRPARRPHPREAPPGSLYDWKMVKQLAEDVAFDRHVRPDAVRACVVVLPVRGLWWQRRTAGTVLCSTAAAGDAKVAMVLLRHAFDSSVRRPAGGGSG